MRTLIFTIIIFFCANSYAQSNDIKQSLLDRINYRNENIDKLKKDPLIDSLRLQIKDYCQLVKLYNEDYEQIQLKYKKQADELCSFELLMSTDTIVFCNDFKAIKNVPDCVKGHYDLVCMIIDLESKLNVVENVAINLENNLGTSSKAYAAIGEKLEPELNEIQSLILEIKKVGFSTLSESQIRYFRPGLTERYNKFKKYY